MDFRDEPWRGQTPLWSELNYFLPISDVISDSFQLRQMQEPHIQLISKTAHVPKAIKSKTKSQYKSTCDSASPQRLGIRFV